MTLLAIAALFFAPVRLNAALQSEISPGCRAGMSTSTPHRFEPLLSSAATSTSQDAARYPTPRKLSSSSARISNVTPAESYEKSANQGGA